MKVTRKEFLRLAVGSVMAAGAAKVVHAIGGSESRSEGEAAGDGKRWGMVIDLQKCRKEKDCEKCVKACHFEHNVPQVPRKAHEVKWIWTEEFDRAFPYQQSEFTRQAAGGTLPVLCNHCSNPACVRVCPTRATWKRKDAVVMMDYHRCIGCRYCMAACPYGARSFNYVDPRAHLTETNPDFPTRSIGVVEKCNFCEERLSRGLLPACAETCPQSAILFGDLNDENSAVRRVLSERYSMQRKPELGCGPSIYYLV